MCGFVHKGYNRVSHKIEPWTPYGKTVNEYYRCSDCGIVAFFDEGAKKYIISAWSLGIHKQRPLEDINCSDFVVKEIIE